MDNFDCEQIDKAMSKRVEAIYSDPSRHQFYSQFQSNIDNDFRGPRGGKIRGDKTACCHCLFDKSKHADVTEQL